jgi:hypothetical protein
VHKDLHNSTFLFCAFAVYFYFMLEFKTASCPHLAQNEEPLTRLCGSPCSGLRRPASVADDWSGSFMLPSFVWLFWALLQTVPVSITAFRSVRIVLTGKLGIVLGAAMSQVASALWNFPLVISDPNTSVNAVSRFAALLARISLTSLQQVTAPSIPQRELISRK